MHQPSHFLAGVIEGFYGQPWTHEERLELLNWMAGWGLNTYVYAPKDDLRQRATWRQLYSAAELEKFRQLLHNSNSRTIRFVYALSPGLDIRYSEPAELEHLRKRFEQMLSVGCRAFALLFDDIQERLHGSDLKQYGSLASAQCHVANALFEWLSQRSHETRLLFCPTAYCGRMLAQGIGGPNYLSIIGQKLLPEIDIFWTGPEIVSHQITLAHVREIEALSRRKPVIWDNLHANDYDGRRFFCGPYAGRPPELRHAVHGLLANPNNEFPLNYVPLRTLAEFVHCETDWDSRKAYLAAIREWLPCFTTINGPGSFEDLVLFGDCYYLPYEEGPEAEALFHDARALLTEQPQATDTRTTAFRHRAHRLREFCMRLADLHDRRLFYALSRRIWELREELDLLEHYVEFKATRPGGAFRSAFHLPGTYRGGLVARLQQLLVQNRDGTFVPANAGQTVRTIHEMPQAAPSLP